MLGGYPIGGDQQPLQLPDYAGQAKQAIGMGATPQGSNPLPNYAGQAQSAVAQGMFAAPPPKPKRDIGNLISSFVLNYAGGMGNPIGQQWMQEQAQRRQAQQEALRQQMAPQHIGDNLVQMGADGQYHTLWTAPTDDTPKPTEQQRNYEWLKTIDPPGAEEYRKNIADPIHWIQVDDPATGGKSMVPVNHNGPLSTQAQGVAGAPQQLDSTPTVEDGWAYTPGPGGRAKAGNWKPAGGASQPGSHTFP